MIHTGQLHFKINRIGNDKNINGNTISIMFFENDPVKKQLTIRVLYLLLFLGLFLVALLLLSPLNLVYFNKTIIFAGISGGVGAIAYGLWYIGVNDETYLKGHLEKYFFYVYLLPFSGIILGAISYCLVVSGLLLIAGVNVPSPESRTSSSMFYYALAFLAGFCALTFQSKIDTIGEVIFETKKQK